MFHLASRVSTRKRTAILECELHRLPQGSSKVASKVSRPGAAQTDSPWFDRHCIGNGPSSRSCLRASVTAKRMDMAGWKGLRWTPGCDYPKENHRTAPYGQVTLRLKIMVPAVRFCPSAPASPWRRIDGGGASCSHGQGESDARATSRGRLWCVCAWAFHLTASVTAKRMDTAGWKGLTWTRVVRFSEGKPRDSSLRTGHAETENHGAGSSILPLGTTLPSSL